MRNWEAWAWLAWIVAFGILETVGLLKRPESGMTLTYFLEHCVPRWVMAAVLGWLCNHFLIEPLAKG